MRLDAVDVQGAVDGALADVRFSIEDERAVLRAVRSGSTRLRRGRMLLIAAALLLALLTAAGVALTFSRTFYEDVAEIQAESGYYCSWSLEQKEAVIRLMAERGVIAQDSELLRAATGKGDAGRRERRIDALMEAHFGRLDTIGLDGMLAAALGDMAQWSMEDKAWYSALLLKTGLMGFDEFVYLLPEAGDISPEEAIAIARGAAAEAFGLAEESLRGEVCDFGVHIRQLGEIAPAYCVSISGEAAGWEVYVSADGRVLDSGDGMPYVFSPAERAAKQEMAQGGATAQEQIAAHEAELLHLNTAVIPLGTLELTQSVDGEGDALNRISHEWMQVYLRSTAALGDGGLIITGILQESDAQSGQVNGIFAGMEAAQPRQTFAICLNLDGGVRWRFALPGDWKLEGTMELADGSLLLLGCETRTSSGSTLDRAYFQLRLSAEGRLLEKIALPTTQEMTGIWTEYESLFYAQAGHGGMLITGTAGPKHICFYAQLDENARPVCVWQFSQAENFSPKLLVTEDGYLLTAYDKKGKHPFFRHYGLSGRQAGEDIVIKAISGRSLGMPQTDASGMVLSTDSWTETNALRARLFAADGTGLAESTTLYTGEYWMALPGCTAGDWHVCGLRHALGGENIPQHFCLVMMKPDGTVCRAALDGLSGLDVQMNGETPVIWPVGENRIAMVGMRQTAAQAEGEPVQKTELVLAVATLPET